MSSENNLKAMHCEESIEKTQEKLDGDLNDIPQCTICLDYINKSACVVVLNLCRHFYHKICIQTWLQRQRDCPKCREDVPSDKGIVECDLNTAKKMWEKRPHKIYPRQATNKEDLSHLSPYRIRKFYDDANDILFGGNLPQLGRIIVGPGIQSASCSQRRDGKLVIGLPMVFHEVEHENNLLMLLTMYNDNYKR